MNHTAAVMTSEVALLPSDAHARLFSNPMLQQASAQHVR
jgi:hypothetical protein